jgi:hypothetical protein
MNHILTLALALLGAVTIAAAVWIYLNCIGWPDPPDIEDDEINDEYPEVTFIWSTEGEPDD